MFFVPAIILAAFWFLDFAVVRDRPSAAGYPDFDLGDAQGGHDKESPWQVIKRLLSNRIIVTIALIEACSGFLRQGILKWSRDFATGIGGAHSLRLLPLGHGVVHRRHHRRHVRRRSSATTSSSRGGPRSPRSSTASCCAGSIAILPVLGAPIAVSWIIAAMAMAIIGVHGMLSGTASADFGGLRNVGVAVGLIDGFVYLGTAVQDFTYGNPLPEKHTVASHQISSWYAWPGAMIPVAVIGLFLAIKVWHARPRPLPACRTPSPPSPGRPDPTRVGRAILPGACPGPLRRRAAARPSRRSRSPWSRTRWPAPAARCSSPAPASRRTPGCRPTAASAASTIRSIPTRACPSRPSCPAR